MSQIINQRKKHSRKASPTDETERKNKLQGLRRMLRQYILDIYKEKKLNMVNTCQKFGK